MSAEYHQAMEQSVAHTFPGNNCINCMCHSTEDIYRWAAAAVGPVPHPLNHSRQHTQPSTPGCCHGRLLCQ